MADATAFRQAWSQFPTGVSVVTTIQPDGHVHGMTANGINSVSLEPLLVLACVGHTANSHTLIEESGRFAISFLSEEQQSIGEYYARPVEKRVGDIEVSFSFTKEGAAFVDGGLAAMDCRVVNKHEAGDHTVFIGEVEEIEVNPGRPLVFFEGKFGGLPPEGFQALYGSRGPG